MKARRRGGQRVCIRACALNYEWHLLLKVEGNFCEICKTKVFIDKKITIGAKMESSAFVMKGCVIMLILSEEY